MTACNYVSRRVILLIPQLPESWFLLIKLVGSFVLWFSFSI
ncbi:hypothetical protein SLEP1_g12928 [Rubroshorea leprosula]|uniref:Uncharacterized protein n=1 Tax=Rubroshorea leprosula TaxID=152421 RepID=A0AAV5IMV7_9ROSI|nr:hypothetical protein SLEP1_g12928 [Rubroshorea leprosula]